MSQLLPLLTQDELSAFLHQSSPCSSSNTSVPAFLYEQEHFLLHEFLIAHYFWAEKFDFSQLSH